MSNLEEELDENLPENVFERDLSKSDFPVPRVKLKFPPPVVIHTPEVHTRSGRLVKPNVKPEFAYSLSVLPARLVPLKIAVAIGGCGQVVCHAKEVGSYFVHRRTGTYFAWSPYDEHFVHTSGELIYVCEEPRPPAPALSRLATTSTRTIPDIPWPELFLHPTLAHFPVGFGRTGFFQEEGRGTLRRLSKMGGTQYALPCRSLREIERLFPEYDVV